MNDAAGVPEDDMTPAERERWLRDRGVVIETSIDRRRAETILSDEGRDEAPGIVEMVRGLAIEGGVDVDEVVDGIKFVYIPHDDSRPVSTLTLPRRLADALGPTSGGGGDVIPIYVRSYFADGASIDVNLFEEQARKQNHHSLLGGTEQLRLDGIKSSSLDDVAAKGSVETFPLVRPSTTNHHVGEYVYLDEVGMLKNLPINKRASSLALRCGYNPPPNFYGDVFVGRISSVPHVHNVDITREDVLDANREWIVRAPGENIAWQKMVDDVTGREGMCQPDHAGTEGVAVHVNGGGDDEDGGGGCSYSWTQNEEEVEITVSLNRLGGGGKMEMAMDKSSIDVVFRPQKISVKRDGELILDVQSYSRLDVNGCTWTLDEGGLVITCEKASEGEIWPRLELSPG
ncbi:hypothetical protein ACHAW5_003773 [Stephanodiscus triporus]|uniref:CS domain-containing protein n=1 Tax=Stephanodiscus triporus TaxID=2934178 RepID=A0ABD3NIC5_9STRA